MILYLLLPTVVLASIQPAVYLQKAFSVKPSCYFTWASYFIGYGVDSLITTTGVKFSDAQNVCQSYTNTIGITGQMVPAITDATSIFPMLQFCQPATNLIAWISSTDSTCNILSGTTRFGQANVGTVIPVPCTDNFSAVFCYFPTAIQTLFSTTVFTTIQGGTTTVTNTNLVPSFSSTTITALSTTPTTTTEIDPIISNTVTVVTSTNVEVSTTTSKTTETTTTRSTLRITDIDSVTTTFTYEVLSITVSVSSVTATELATSTLTVCDD